MFNNFKKSLKRSKLKFFETNKFAKLSYFFFQKIQKILKNYSFYCEIPAVKMVTPENLIHLNLFVN